MTRKDKKNRRGFILSFLWYICNRISSLFSQGALSKLFAMHDRARKAYSESFIVSFASKLLSRNGKHVYKFRKSLSRQFENSLILNTSSKIFSKLLSIPSRVVGVFYLTWSAYAVLVYIIKTFVLRIPNTSLTDLICGAVVFLSSVPLMFAEGSVRKLCSGSKFVSKILRNVFGIPTEVLETRDNARIAQSPAVALGIFLGLLTYFVSPIKMLTALALFLCVVLVMSYPESGVIISICAAPFVELAPSPSILLACFVLVTDLAYLIKTVRGKRVFKFGLTELAVFGFMCTIFLAGFAPGTNNTFENALLRVSLMSVFFPAVGLMKNKHWVRMCCLSVAIPAFVIGYIGIAQYMLGYAPFGWTDTSLFGGITSRAVSLFNNPNILGVYLAIVLPMALTLTLPKHSTKLRIIGAIGSSFIIICTIFTYSRSAWIGMLVGALSFACMIAPRGILWLIPIAGAGTMGAIICPDTFGARILNFFSLADSANGYRIAVWNSSFELLINSFAGGIGLGEEAFKTAYVNFAGAGTQSAMHSHSLYMQIVIECGLIGLVLMLLAVFTVISKCRTESAKPLKNKELTYISKAAISGAAALLISGVFDYTWYNNRVFFLFWALLGIACAAVNASEAENIEYLTFTNDARSSFLTVSIPNSTINKNYMGDDD